MRQPNILMIMTDTQATNMLGCYTGLPLGTEHLDRLAASGTMFGSAFTTCPVCTPARSALFTGIYSSQSGAWTNNIALGANMRTMGAYFKAAGYRTAFIGKWHLDGHDYFGTGQCPPEWDDAFWFDGKRYLDEKTDAEIALWRNGLNSADDLRRHGIGAEFTWARGITRRAKDFLATTADDDRPYLLVLSFDEPHHPFTCPPDYVDRWADFAYPLGRRAGDPLKDKPEHQRLWAEAMPSPVGADGLYRHPSYFACNDFVDDEIGSVIEAARPSPWVVFTSDHGEMMGAHRLISKGAAAYDDITRIPLLIRPPEVAATAAAAAGRRIDTPVSHIDLLPTLLDIAGIARPEALQGESLLPLLAGVPCEHRDVLIEFNRYEIEHDSFGGFIPMRALVTDAFKLVLNLFDSDELYDRRNDPDELVNLIDAPHYARIRDALHDRLLARMDALRDPYRAYRWAVRPWRPDKQPEWMGAFRPKPDDGVSPVVRDYDTGLPTQGVKIEEKLQKF
jgi:uncharacterized sulfatase